MLENELYSARNYDRGMWLLERTRLSRLRRQVVRQAIGNTLEIGAGTGANAAHYQVGVTVTATDLQAAHLSAAAKKASRLNPGLRYTVVCADAQQLPFPDSAFDTVLGTLVFCSIGQPELALAAIRRVLRPGGRLILLEHVRGQTPLTRRLTDWLHPAWFALQGVCHLNRDTAATVAAAGFNIHTRSDHAHGLIQIIFADVPAD
ncbi:MAG: class I SAM-dependent methyltransferase [Candidatus Promineofilum sp.]|nr:class I SAM-dependent methyltransferase [Promineifilum sp.]